jgi:Ca2+-binding RTX toxin-like protein
LEAVVTQWAGASGISSTSRGDYVNARHLAVVEAFTGLNYTENSQFGHINPPAVNGVDLEEAFSTLMAEMATRFITQGTLKAVFGNPYYDFTADKMVFSLSAAQILTNAQASQPLDAADRAVYWSEVARTILTYRTDFGLSESAAKTQINNAAGGVVLVQPLGAFKEGTNTNDALKGGVFADYLFGLSGNDTLTGGKGADSLEGGEGNDMYKYYLGDGNDTIYDTSTSTDKIVFGTGITFGSLTFTRPLFTDNVTISIAGGGSVFIINQVSGSPNYMIENLGFSDGSIFSSSQIRAKLLEFTSGNDTIEGFDKSNDTIQGGLGNDSLRDEGGNDTYIYLRGDGNDTIYDAQLGVSSDKIVFGEGITLSNLTFGRGSGNDITISINGGGSLLIKAQYSGYGYYTIENIQFSDGSVFSSSQIKAVMLSSTSGNDSITGFDVSDSIMGGLGNDTIVAQDGNDTLDGGDGNDMLYAKYDDDSVLGGAGNDYLDGDQGADTLNGGLGDDTLLGGRDNDLLLGLDGIDRLNGGGGVDTMTGGLGVDHFYFTSLSDSTDTVLDRITDFSRAQGDKIDFSVFSFTGITTGTPTAGQLVISQVAGNTLVSDPNSTFALQCDGIINLVASDFLF